MGYGLSIHGQALPKKEIIEVIDTDYIFSINYRYALVEVGALTAQRSITLPYTGQEQEGDTIIIKDRSGSAFVHTIRITGTGGIDNVSEYFISNNYGSKEFTFQNGMWWIREDIESPNGEYVTASDQFLTAANTATDIVYNIIQSEIPDLELINSSEFKARVRGWYSFRVYLNVENNTSSVQKVVTCLQLDTGSGYNGVPNESSATIINFDPNLQQLILESVVKLEVGWKIKTVWAASDTNVKLLYISSPLVGISDIPSSRIVISKDTIAH